MFLRIFSNIKDFILLDFNDISNNELYNIKSKKLLKTELKSINKILKNK